MSTKTKATAATIVHADGTAQSAVGALRDAILTNQSERVLLVPSVSRGCIFPTIFRAGRELTLPAIDHPSLADRAGVGHLHELIEQQSATDVHVSAGALHNMLGGDLTRAESVRAALEPLAAATRTQIVLTVPTPPAAAVEPQTPVPVDPYVASGLKLREVTNLTAEQARQVGGLLAARSTTIPAQRTWDGAPVSPGTSVVIGSPGRYSGRLLATVYDATGRGSERYWDAARDTLTAFQWAESLLAEKTAQLLIIDGGLGEHDARLTLDLDALAREHDVAVAVLP